MRIKLDENLPARLVPALARLGHDVHTVNLEFLQGVSDVRLWEVVQQEGRFLITQDLDFSDTRRYIPGTHAGILLLRLANPGRVQLFNIILKLFTDEDPAAWQGAYVVATEHKVRVTR